jgi:hypothetical protein
VFAAQIKHLFEVFGGVLWRSECRSGKNSHGRSIELVFDQGA